MNQLSPSYKSRVMQHGDQTNPTANTRMARNASSQSDQETFMDQRGVRQDLLSFSDGIFSHISESKFRRILSNSDRKRKSSDLLLLFPRVYSHRFCLCRSINLVSPRFLVHFPIHQSMSSMISIRI